MKDTKALRFLEKAKLKHQGKYDYSKVWYVGSTTKVIIVCPQHGPFEQRPNAHLFGKGCLKCSIEARTQTLEGFITNAILVHGDRYDYRRTVYVNVHSKVVIKCKRHGAFKVTPNSHLAGVSCQKCNIESKMK